jgi:A/G-specific adenine glycosylase
VSSPQQELLSWYAANKRDLPWRHTRDPYRILVSEVMLQQTQVDRVLPFYQRWLASFPDAQTCAEAELEVIHRQWKGLGYPSRAERLQLACREVVQQRCGQWPDTAAGLQELPGIGPYTAGAVACFAFAAAVPLVDTNVARVYARRDGLTMPPDKKELWAHAAAQVDPGDPISYNNALMELGALICGARSADCGACPWRERCVARGDDQRQQETANPLKVASRKDSYGVAITDRKKPRHHVVLALIHHDGRYLVAKRPHGAHVGGFWELPGGKREKGEDDRVALAREVIEELGGEILAARPFVSWNHDYGDRYISFHCYRCRLFKPEAVAPLAADELQWVEPAAFMQLNFPPANGPVQQRFKKYHRL